jgi:hypothetical protein
MVDLYPKGTTSAVSEWQLNGQILVINTIKSTKSLPSKVLHQALSLSLVASLIYPSSVSTLLLH